MAVVVVVGKPNKGGANCRRNRVQIFLELRARSLEVQCLCPAQELKGDISPAGSHRRHRKSNTGNGRTSRL